MWRGLAFLCLRTSLAFLSPGPISPDHCVSVGSGLEPPLFINISLFIKVEARDANDEPLTIGGGYFVGLLNDTLHDYNLKLDFNDRMDGTYLSEFTIPDTFRPGNFSLSISYEDAFLLGFPRLMDVRNPTDSPTSSPTSPPTSSPTTLPPTTSSPTDSPTTLPPQPTSSPTSSPTLIPTTTPTPTTSEPTTNTPTKYPTTNAPTNSPTTGMISAPKCLAKGQGLKEATTRELATFSIEAYDEQNQRVRHGGANFSISLLRHRISSYVRDNGDGTYNCGYTPLDTNKSAIQLHVTLDGVNIKGSPFLIDILDPLPSLSKQTVLYLAIGGGVVLLLVVILGCYCVRKYMASSSQPSHQEAEDLLVKFGSRARADDPTKFPAAAGAF